MSESSISPDISQRIDAYLASTSFGRRRPRVVPLTGDASDRRYFRVCLDGDDSIVLALHTGAIAFDTMPFATMSALLERMSVPVPRILGHSDPLGIIALQDLGDVTLQAQIGSNHVATHERLYREAVALIHQLQVRGAECVTSSVPYTLAFDVEKLTFELDFFTTHFLAGYRGVSLAPSTREALGSEWAQIANDLSAEPRVVCHRDYHSRNVMVYRGALYVIDFQDARLGPDTYDLASLLRDSYVDITDGERDALITHFVQLAGVLDAGEFRRRFDLMCVQRNIKALGTFGFQASARGNPGYVQYMARTLHAVRGNLLRYARFTRLHALLGAHVEELR